jgi:hypothetical protein
MTSHGGSRLWTLGATAVGVAGALAVVTAYFAKSLALVAYPWDWSPDEGLFLDHAKRFFESPASLYGRSYVPFPSAYGPVLLLLIAPAVAATGSPLLHARLVALAWTVAICAAVYWLARRKAPRPLALAAVALSLVPFDLTFWHMLVRPDGPMLALLLLAAIPLLPAALTPGADRLTPARTVAGTGLALAAVLAKITAVAHAAPLVLGWLLVDRRGALRLAAALAAAGLAALGIVQLLTRGGFVWVNGVWSYHATQPVLPIVVLGAFLQLAWPLVVVWLATLAAAPDRRAVLRDGATLLLLGAVAVLPLATKYGASWNYLIPAIPCLAVATARAWAGGGTLLGLPRAALGTGLLGTASLLLALSRPYPVPTPEDEVTARTFYAYVADVARETRAPILAMRPEYAYFHVGQPVEMEGSGFFHLARGGAPGSEIVERRLAEASYGLVIWTWPLPDVGSYRASAARHYARAGDCRIGYYFGTVTATLLPRRGVRHPRVARDGARCTPAATPASN